MSGWLRAICRVWVLCAIFAYVALTAVHGATVRQSQAASQSVTASSSGLAENPSHQGFPGITIAGDVHAKAPAPSSSCPSQRQGSVSCCVATCLSALPSPMMSGLWTPELGTASDSGNPDVVRSLFVTRLDRPPKSGIAPIG